MEIFRVVYEDRALFDWLDPLYLLDLLALPNYFALAMVTEDEPMECAALLIGSYRDTEVVVEWLCTAPAYRLHGLAFDLVEYVRTRLCLPSGKALGARFPVAEDISAGSKDMEHLTPAARCAVTSRSFFTEMGFVDEKPDAKYFHVSLSDIASREDQSILDTSKIRPLSAFPVKEQMAAVSQIWKRPQANRLFEFDPAPEDYDADISCLIPGSSAPSGLVLIRRTGHLVVPLLMYAASARAGISLMMHCLRLAAETESADAYSDDAASDAEPAEAPTVLLIAGTRQSMEFGDKLFSGTETDTVICYYNL